MIRFRLKTVLTAVVVSTVFASVLIAFGLALQPVSSQTYWCVGEWRPPIQTVWVRSKPKLRGAGATTKEAVEALKLAIRESEGVKNPKVEFDPPISWVR